MGKRTNELFIGKEHINIEGRTIKHPALIAHYASLNVNKTSDSPLSFIGLDLETNHKTAELKLLGFWLGSDYAWYDSQFTDVILMYIKYCYEKDVRIAYWNRLDPFVIYKQFLSKMNDDDRQASMHRYGKIAGEWNYKNKKWDIPPVCEIECEYTGRKFGIQNVIRSSIQFFYYNEGDDRPKTVWAFDIAQLYEYGLEKEATSRFPYYSKVDKSAHLVDWDRFVTDKDYKENIVLKSNMLDARAVYDLANNITDEFKRAFGYYPKTLISTGSLARSAIIATLKSKYSKETDNEDAIKASVLNDAKSIGFLNFYDEQIKFAGLRDLYALCTEAYSGGYIESIRYGYTDKAYYADIASAYPAHIMQLYDLRGSVVTTGKGEPPHIEYSYCLIRGDVDIPDTVNFHPITVKHPVNKDTNIRATGQYRASYTLEERDFLIAQGAKFSNETWYNIKTTGKLSPLAEVAKHFIDLRTEFRKNNDSAQYVAKIAVNSLYGILFEAVDTWDKEERVKEIVIDEVRDDSVKKLLRSYHKKFDFTSIEDELKYRLDNEYNKVKSMWAGGTIQPDEIVQELAEFGIWIDSDNKADIMLEINELYRLETKFKNTKNVIETEIVRAGYRAGEFFNPLYATIITSRTRLLLAKAATAIEKNKGKAILLMTDSVFWTGKSNMLPNDLWKEIKTVGYFEKPTEIKSMVCLGSGRYSFINNKNEKMTSKSRGLNATDLHDPDGVIIDDFNWLNALKIIIEHNTDTIDIGVRTLISVGLILNNHNYTWKDLGRVVEEKRNVDVIVGKTKRFYSSEMKTPRLLADRLIDTYPLSLGYGMFGDDEINDQTLPQLRNEMMKYQVMSLKERDKANKNKAQKKYQKKKEVKDAVNGKIKSKYQQLKDLGYSATEARKMSKWGLDAITMKLMEDNKL